MLLKRGTGWDAVEQIIEAPAVNGFLAETESFCDLIDAGPAHWSGATNEESLDIMLTLDAILSSAKSGNAVNIGIA
jgi:predicted dehydrogenase